jgi:hypothetical protein
MSAVGKKCNGGWLDSRIAMPRPRTSVNAERTAFDAKNARVLLSKFIGLSNAKMSNILRLSICEFAVEKAVEVTSAQDQLLP